MNDDYLWDRSGPPDLEVARLERRLAPLRYRHRRRSRPSRVRWAMAGALIAAAAGLVLMVTPGAQSTSWQVAGAKLRQGQTVRTGNTAVRLEAEEIGRVDLAANSVLRAMGGKRLALERGELHAFIWAPAREFVVETPSARAVDLGCEYTLNVDEKGDGVLRVKMGWVAFQVGDREAFIPAGATCVTRRRGGPGIPYFEDASDGLRRGVERFERGDRGALNGLLAAARPRDGTDLVASVDARSGSGPGRGVRPLPRSGATARRSFPRRRIAPRRAGHRSMLERARSGEYGLVAGLGEKVVIARHPPGFGCALPGNPRYCPPPCAGLLPALRG